MSDAAMPLSLDNISEEKIKRFKQHPQLLKALDEWCLFADRRLIPQMAALGELVREMYNLPNELKLYRGFRLGSFQDNLGIDEDARIGQSVSYESHDRSLSFSTEESIAHAFGNVVVSTKIHPKKDPCLVITDELVVIIHELRNLKQIKTQHEVILLPPIKVQLQVVNKESNSFSWLGW
jgi:hypothetical protein